MNHTHRSYLFKHIVCAISLFFISCSYGNKSKTNSNPTNQATNILLVIVDDLGQRDLGIYGSTFYETPNIDAFAKRSVTFSNAYAASPVCSPTRAAIMTGKDPARLKITDWISGWGDKNKRMKTPKIREQLPLEEITLAELAKQQGYKTFFAGKWHLGKKGYHPDQQGFAINKGGFHGGRPYHGYYAPYKNPKLKEGPEGEYLPDRLTQETIDFMLANKSAPFLAVLSFYTVHTPIQASKRHIAYYKEKAKARGFKTGKPVTVKEGRSVTTVQQQNAAYASMVAAMDENIGRLLSALRSSGLDKSTTVIFTSDNGGLATNRKSGAPTSNAPLRAGKAFLYEGGIRIPLIIQAPSQNTRGAVNDTPVTSVDLFPTIAALLAANDLPENLDGVNLLPLLASTTATDDQRALYWHYPHYHTAGWRPGGAIREGNWKLVEHFETGDIELYNLSEDLSEQHDLSKNHPEVASSLYSKLKKWRRYIGAEMPVMRKR